MAEELNDNEQLFEALDMDPWTGIVIERKDGLKFDLYDIRLPVALFYKMEHEDGLIDVFLFNILGPDKALGGRVLLFDVPKRLAGLPGAIKAMWSNMVRTQYAVLMQTVPDNVWYLLGGTDSMTEAAGLFQDWINAIGPKAPIRVPNGDDMVTIWNSGRPGIRMIGTFAPPQPFDHVTNPN